MSGFLLDTHALIWFATGNLQRMPQATADLIADASNDVFVSAATIWEISTKSRLGKLQGLEDIAVRPNHYLAELSMVALPITLEHAGKAGAFDVDHRDPFDRMLAAQSLIEELNLISVDQAIDAFGVQRVWPT